MDHHLSLEESIRFGWAKTRAHSTLIFQALLTIFGVQIAEQVVMRVLRHSTEGMLASAVLFGLVAVLGVGLTVIILRLTEGKHATYADLLPPMNVWLPYIGAVIVAAIVTVVPVIVALLLCIIVYALLPYAVATVVCAVMILAAIAIAAYIALRYVFVRFAILDDRNIVQSLAQSAALTRGRKWWLAGFVITIGLLNILGALLFMVGLLVSIPVTLFAFAHVYVQLRAHHL